MTTTATERVMALADKAARDYAARDIPTGELYRGIAEQNWQRSHAALRAEVQKLEDEIERLNQREANARCSHCGGVLFVTDATKALIERAERAKAECEALRKDALRYRELRKQCNDELYHSMTPRISCAFPANSTYATGAALDAAIDAAIAQEEK